VPELFELVDATLDEISFPVFAFVERNCFLFRFSTYRTDLIG